MKKLLFTLVFIIFACPFILSQQQSGDKELGIAGSFYRSIGGDMTFATASAQGKLGFYLSDNFEIGFTPILTWSYSSYEGLVAKKVTRPTSFYPYTETVTIYEKGTITQDNTTFGAGIFFNYSFLASPTTVPYFGAQFYKSNFKNEDDKGNAGINAGIKFYLSRKTAWDFGFNYLFDLNEKTEGSVDGYLLIQIGISFLF